MVETMLTTVDLGKACTPQDRSEAFSSVRGKTMTMW